MRSFGVCVLVVIAIFCGTAKAGAGKLTELEETEVNKQVQSAIKERAKFLAQKLSAHDAATLASNFVTLKDADADGHLTVVELTRVYAPLFANVDNANEAAKEVIAEFETNSTIKNNQLEPEEVAAHITAYEGHKLALLAYLFTGKKN